ncbi:MAG: zeta toxin family protein [Gemmataceae bacterium]|nr:zeta toxin family protein [Gemmataceae bacterium]
MPDISQKRVIIIAGPNGAGKSTFAREFLPNEADCLTFVNADLIAAGLSPFAPEAAAMRAGRIMVAEIQRHAKSGVSFAFETTLAGRRYARMIPTWQSAGYHVHLIFLGLHDADLAVARVAVRVLQGGHDVAEEVIRRRFAQGWMNFQNTYRDLVDWGRLYDKSGEQAVLIDEGKRP